MQEDLQGCNINATSMSFLSPLSEAIYTVENLVLHFPIPFSSILQKWPYLDTGRKLASCEKGV